MNSYSDSLRQLLNKARTWHISPGMVYAEPFSAEEFLKLVDSINAIYVIARVGINSVDYVEEVANLNIKAKLVRCIDMKTFWDIAE